MQKKFKVEKFITVNDNIDLNDYWILERTFINNELVKEIKSFLEFLIKKSSKEFLINLKNKKKEIEDKLEKGSYNNFYDILENLNNFYKKNSTMKNIFFEYIEEYFTNVNGHKTINLFDESEEYDIFFHKQKFLLEKNLSSIINDHNRINKFHTFVTKFYSKYFKSDSVFEYEKMSLKELEDINTKFFNKI